LMFASISRVYSPLDIIREAKSSEVFQDAMQRYERAS